MSERPTHLDATGTARMVDVSAKETTARAASAVAFVVMSKEPYAAARRGDASKGDILGTARLAGIMAAKRTGDLIPLCHPLGLSHVDVRFAWLDDLNTIAIRCDARCAGQTGVEMEAMTGASVAALTVYDMVKGIDRGVSLTNQYVLSKHGGKSGDWTHPSPPGPSLTGIDWR